MVSRLRTVSHDEEALLFQILELLLVSESLSNDYLPEVVFLAQSDVRPFLVLRKGLPLSSNKLQGLDS